MAEISQSGLGGGVPTYKSVPDNNAVVTNIWEVIPPSRAPFQFSQWSSGPQGDATYDHWLGFGFNAEVHAGTINTIPSEPALYMGFEDGWWDGSKGGAEWYIAYFSPTLAGSLLTSDRAVQLFRPFYTRVDRSLKTTTVAVGSNGVNTNTFAGAGVLNVASTAGFGGSVAVPDKIQVITDGTIAIISFTGKTANSFTGCTTTSGGGVLTTGAVVSGYAHNTGTILDIGTDGTGSFQISAGGFTPIFTVIPNLVTFKALTGSSTIIIDSNTISSLLLKLNGVAGFQIAQISSFQVQVLDSSNGAREHMLWQGGANSLAALTSFDSIVRLAGGPLSLQNGAYAGGTNVGSLVASGTGAPNNANGVNGDFYLRTDGAALTTIYQKRAAAWVGIV